MPMRDVRNERLGEFVADGIYLNNGGNGYPGDGWVRLYFGNGNPTPIMMNGTDIAIDGMVSANQLVGGLDNLANVIPPASTDDVGAIGTSGSIARGDHQHPLQAIGDAGTYNQVTTDAFGRVVSGSSVAYLTGNQTVTLSGDASGSGATAITVTLATVNSNVGTFGSASAVPVITTDGKGRITAASAASITPAAIGALPLTGGALTGSLTLAGDPAGPLQAATQQYVDNIAQGLDVKASVLAATTANITLSGAQTIDGVSVTAGARVLAKSQTAQAQNGIYVAASGAWSRATDMDAWSEVPGAFVFVEQGTVNGDTGWVCTANQGGTLGTTAITWTQFAGVGTYTGSGLITVTGTTIGTSMATGRLIGRTTAGTGATEEIAVGTGLTLSGGTLAAAISASAAQPLGATASAGSTGTVADAGHIHQRQLESIIVAAGDETTAITAGTGKVSFRMPYAFTVTAVRASLATAQTSGSLLTIDVKESGASIFSTKPTFNNGSKTTVGATTPAVISDTALADDAEITIDVAQIGDGTAKGLKVTLIGRQSA